MKLKDKEKKAIKNLIDTWFVNTNTNSLRKVS